MNATYEKYYNLGLTLNRDAFFKEYLINKQNRTSLNEDTCRTACRALIAGFKASGRSLWIS